MKRILSSLLVFALVFTMLVPAFAFAAEEKSVEEKYNELKDAGIFKGLPDGTPGLDKTMTRAELAAIIARLLNLEPITGQASFNDTANNWAHKEGVIEAVAKAGYMGSTSTVTKSFSPDADVTLAELAKIVVTVLKLETDPNAKVEGVTQDWAHPYVDAALKAGIVAKASNYHAKATRGDLVYGTYVAYDKINVEKKPLAVSSVKVDTAKSFKVTFSKAVEDTAKVKFDVKRSGVATAVTTTWNADKTEATLTSSAKLVVGDYTIAVTNDATDLGTFDAKVEQEKLAKIEFDNLVIRTGYDSNAQEDKGVVGFAAYNQYGENITNTALARSIQFTTSTTSFQVDWTNGVLTLVQKGIQGVSDLAAYKKVIVNAYDPNTGVVATKELEVSETIGGISEIKLTGLTDEKGNPVDALKAGSSKYYITYEVIDTKGNKITSYKILGSSAVLVANPAANSGALATVEVVDKDGKAALEVTVASSILTDTKAVFTVYSPFSGKSASLTVDLKKENALAQVLISAPATEVSEGETAEIPVVAYDQYGNQLTKYDSIKGKYTLTVSGPGNATVSEKKATDGSYKLYISFPTKGKYFLQATTNTGKYSTVYLDVQETAVPEKLTVTPDYLGMVEGSTQSLDFLYGQFAAKDQYGRSIDLAFNDQYGNAQYYVEAVYNGNVLDINGGPASRDNAIEIEAKQAGSATVKFVLKKKVGTSVQDVDYKTVTFRVVQQSDVVDYGVAVIGGNTLYVTGEANYTSATPWNQGYASTLDIYGLTSDGLEVALAGSETAYYSVDKPVAFEVYGNKLFARKLTSENEGKVTATVKVGNQIFTAQADVKTSLANPVAQSISVWTNSADRLAGNIVVNGDVYTVKQSLFGTDGIRLTRYDFNNTSVTNSPLQFRVVDQYKKNGLAPAYFVVTNVSSTVTVDPAALNKGVLKVTGTGSFDITAVSNNALTKTITINVVN